MSKITAEHLQRSACVYIRQSTPDQLVHHPALAILREPSGGPVMYGRASPYLILELPLPSYSWTGW